MYGYYDNEEKEVDITVGGKVDLLLTNLKLSLYNII